MLLTQDGFFLYVSSMLQGVYFKQHFREWTTSKKGAVKISPISPKISFKLAQDSFQPLSLDGLLYPLFIT